MDGLPSSSVPQSPLSPYMTYHPTSTASWVNGLWFTSLVLSLTTALIAVLTKQWIHEYRTSIELGTYRERGRIRQFRFTNLSDWHVPVIIGLLPVLMHVALGVFFAGLIILLLSLSRHITASISVVVAAALAAYLVTNVIPVFNPACPYKTPLTHYVYRIIRLVGNTPSPKLLERFSRLINLRSFSSRTAPHLNTTANNPSSLARVVDIAPSSDTQSFAPLSLVEAEKAIVQEISYIIDAQATVWLYGVSSNSSVQTIVLQAICNLPLRSIPLITRSIPASFLERAIRNALEAPENHEPSAQAAYERLQRSLIRICPEKNLTWPPRQLRASESLPSLLNQCESENAATFLSKQILAPSATHDITVWVQILRNALASGPEWLGMYDDNSPVWRTFISWFLSQRHACRRCSRLLYSCTIQHYALTQRRKPCYLDFKLAVFRNPWEDVSTTQPITFQAAVTSFLRPSLSEFILQVVYPQYNQEPVYLGVPRDIQLRHVLIQLPYIQSTGSHDDFNISSLVAQLIAGIESDIDVRGEANHTRHPRVLHASFHTLASVASNAFVQETLPMSEKQRLLHPLFTALMIDANLSARSQSLGKEYKSLRNDYYTFMSDFVAEKIIQTTFVETVNLSELALLISNLLQSAVHFRCTKLLPQIYEKLCSGGWLNVICASHFGQTRHRPSFMAKTSHTFLVAAFVEGLNILQQISAFTYARVMEYIQTPSNLLSLCKVFVLSDVERRKGLETLVPFVSAELWEPCLQDLDQFVRHPAVRDDYELHRLNAHHPFLGDCPLSYSTCEEVFEAVSDFRRDRQQQVLPRQVPSQSRKKNKVTTLTSCCSILIHRT